jgi:hypothetical protein
LKRGVQDNKAPRKLGCQREVTVPHAPVERQSLSADGIVFRDLALSAQTLHRVHVEQERKIGS